MKKIAIIGAGISGIVCAHQLNKHEKSVHLFDKSRGASGRSTTKRWPNSTLGIDMGVPYMYQHEIDQSNTIIKGLITNKHLTNWQFQSHKNNQTTTKNTMIGQPKMSSIARALTNSIKLISQTKIDKIDNTNGWEIWSDSTKHGPYDALVLALPAAQYNLITGIPQQLQDMANQCTNNAINTLLIETKNPIWTTDHAEYILNSTTIQSVIADYQKPNRNANQYTYAIHSQRDWATNTFDKYEKTDIEAIMLNELNSQFDLTNNQIIHTLCHRWKFGEVINNQNTNPFISTKNNLYCCGDWLHKQSFIGALESGYQLAMHIAE